MRFSPSIVPPSEDNDIYLVLDEFGHRQGRAWREANEEDTDRGALLRHLMEGQSATRSASSASTPPKAGRAMPRRRSPPS
jgi:hypothetical protein